MGYVWLDEEGKQKDVLDILAGFGINALRFRVFVDPPVNPVWIKSENDVCFLGYANSESVLESARKAIDKNFRIMIDFHYSDCFADPSCQLMPRQWEGHSYEKLLDDVYEHTYKVMNLLAKQIFLDCRIIHIGLAVIIQKPLKP